MNWFAITGWTIALMLGHTIIRSASNLQKQPGRNVSNEALGLVVMTLVVVWIVVAIQRGS